MDIQEHKWPQAIDFTSLILVFFIYKKELPKS